MCGWIYFLNSLIEWIQFWFRRLKLSLESVHEMKLSVNFENLYAFPYFKMQKALKLLFHTMLKNIYFPEKWYFAGCFALAFL